MKVRELKKFTQTIPDDLDDYDVEFLIEQFDEKWQCTMLEALEKLSFVSLDAENKVLKFKVTY